IKVLLMQRHANDPMLSISTAIPPLSPYMLFSTEVSPWPPVLQGIAAANAGLGSSYGSEHPTKLQQEGASEYRRKYLVESAGKFEVAVRYCHNRKHVLLGLLRWLNARGYQPISMNWRCHRMNANESSDKTRTFERAVCGGRLNGNVRVGPEPPALGTEGNEGKGVKVRQGGRNSCVS
ncbi:hypothetical protein V5O48_018800, partial [Marasmius crinis-equi]